VETLLAYSER